MSATVEDPQSAARPNVSLVLCVVVATSVVVGYVLLEDWWTTHAFDEFVRLWGSARYDVYMFASVMVPATLYATLLAVWGIDAHHRVTGAVCALVAGLAVWGLQEVYRWHIIKDTSWTGATVLAFNLAVTLLPPTLLALAWGLARRRRRIWLLGVAVAPLLAGIDYQRMLRWWGSLYFQQGDWAVPSAEFLGPVVAACLVCWLLEVTIDTSRTRSG